MRLLIQALFIFTLLAGLISCGNGTDPTNILGDPNQIPSLSLPVTVTNFTNYVQQYAPSTGHDGFDFPTFTQSVAVVAPAPGVIARVDKVNEIATVTIFHSSRFASRIANIASSIRVGDTVAQNQTIGTTTAYTLRFSFLVNGVTVCPYSYLNGDALKTISNAFGSYAPCAD